MAHALSNGLRLGSMFIVASCIHALGWVNETDNAFASTVSYSYSFIDGPGIPTGIVPTDINDRGEIVGFYGDSAGRPNHDFLLSNGNFQTIDVPGANSQVYFSPRRSPR